MGTLIMFVGAGGSFAAGLLGWPWATILLGAVLWVLGYFMHKPRAVEVLRRSPGSLLSSLLLTNGAACAVLFLLGRAFS